jgi:histidine phosphotransfer protein HptB
VHELLETTGNDPSFVIELIDTYLTDSVGLLETMQRSIDTADADGLRRAAHSLKSNSATFGARTLVAECLGLEHRRATGSLSAPPRVWMRSSAVSAMSSASFEQCAVS